ncbi:BTAD domain-containing putative transcriptional regulator [Microbacterium sp.]|uniref:BTAD domain-containing putative transcriptional regulator n=1 Tax=Microbacterium sp. TaxID=51671 RepID=UPI002609ABE3|nr:BTAD domain-containing putative transcriptional regulator [Microbacterium sp.]
MLEVSVLGSVRASTGGQEHPIGGSKQRGLLARLVVSRGRSLSAERLIDELWDDVPPRDPAHALQARVSRLRSAVPIDIEWRDGGYRIDPNDIQTDAARFEQFVQRGNALLAEGDLSQAATLIGDGLDLWRGTAFAGLHDVTALRVESVRLENLWSAAIADRIDLDLALGRSAAVVSELHALLEENPLAERHWSQLIAALYCDGRIQEALDAFSRARRIFAEQLGVEPSSELSRLHLGVLQDQPPQSLLRLSSATLTESRAGEIDVEIADTPIHCITSNQPDILAAMVRDGRTSVLTGPDGIGKTHLLRAIRTQFEAQRCTASLLIATPLSYAVPLGIFAGVVPEKWMTPAALVEHFTRNRSTTVLLVDNVEQLDDASLFVISQLIRNSRVPMVLTATDLDGVPDDIRALYDSGDIGEITVAPLTSADADELVLHTIGGSLTPASRLRIFALAQGNPLHLREILTASVNENRLIRTDHGWELQGEPASTKRLAQLVGERFEGLDDASIEAAAKIAIAGEYPVSGLESIERRMLARAGVVTYSAPGWLRLSHPLDGEFLRRRCSDALWRELSLEVLEVLRTGEAAAFSAVRRHAHILMLDLGEPVEVEPTLELAQYALGAFDERLARRAAAAVIDVEPDNTAAHRIAGIAASMLGDFEASAAHFEAAARSATTPEEQTATALAHAQHVGLRHHDAPAALDIIEQALATMDDPREIAHLQRDALRWSVIAGQTREIADAPGDTSNAVAVRGLLTAANAAVVTGPLEDATVTLQRLRQAPAEIIALVPGGAALIELISIMALSNTGDITASRRRFEQAIADAEANAPESIGSWEYGLALIDLLCGNVHDAYEGAASATLHLQWRDTSGLFPAALALAGGTALAAGHADEAAARFDAVPSAADTDPKVVMLRAWADAWRENAAGHPGAAARLLVDSARWMLAAQHTFFAGLLAHCAVKAVGATRVSGPPGTSAVADDSDAAGDDSDALGDVLGEAIAVLEEAWEIGHGGLLGFLVRHAVATASDDRVTLDKIAREAETLGMASTAADTWVMLAQPEHAARDGLPTALWTRGEVATPPLA